MLLDRIDIDEHGPLRRVELGPFSEQLNVVYGPGGSGKTAIARFLRDSLVNRQYPLGMMSSSTGRVVWADRNGLVHCVREKDGTSEGRTRVELERREDREWPLDSLRHSWISGIGETSVRTGVADAIELPEPLVDAVITDTVLTDVSRVVAACIVCGLDSPETYRSLTLDEVGVAGAGNVETATIESRRQTLRSELANVEVEIAHLDSQPLDYPSLMRRRRELQERLVRQSEPQISSANGSTFDVESAQRQLTRLCELARELRARQSMIRRWLGAIDETHVQYDPHRYQDEGLSDTSRLSATEQASQRAARSRELDRVTHQLDGCLAEAAEIRRKLRSFDAPLKRRSAAGWTDPEAVRGELHRVDQQLATWSRLEWLNARRQYLLTHLSDLHLPIRVPSPLADAANRWLVRLSAGRLRRIDWHGSVKRSNTNGTESSAGQPEVQIEGRIESLCPEVDRSLAALAVRMAAGELLALKGKSVPLLVEIHQRVVEASVRKSLPSGVAFYRENPLGQANHAFTVALQDYARAGHQVLVFTSDEEFSDQLLRAGGRMFRIHAEPIVHSHRPIWRPQYASEHYVGPHAHTSGREALRPASSPSVVDINRDFDVAWREAYGLSDVPPRAGQPRVSECRDAAAHAPSRDGYFYADSYTTVSSPAHYRFDDQGNWVCISEDNSVASRRSGEESAVRAATSPFFLTVDSPIDQAPSVDAVAAARLRRLKVTHVTHLMQQDANRLADALGLTGVNAATIRRWQAECRLACRVPHLRGFDARVLVGCGVTDPEQLAAIHPSDLLQEVEAFLATDRGQSILLSGSSQELSRITSWIAAANSSPAEQAVAAARSETADYNETSHRNSFAAAFGGRRRPPRRTRGDQRNRDSRGGESSGSTGSERTQTVAENRRARSGGHRKRARVSAEARAARSVSDHDRSTPSRNHRGSAPVGNATAKSRRQRLVQFRPPASGGASSNTPAEASSIEQATADGTTTVESWRFYLHRDSPIVDAPSIGERMAERLEAIDVCTVNDLLAADAEVLAAELDHRRVDSDVVTQWQLQSELVCRVPMLRGHDAQLLVLAEVTTPEELAEADPETLFEQIDPISHSKAGARILRGGKRPDLAEVRDWVDYAQHTRELIAA